MTSLHPSRSSVPVPMPTDWLQCALSYYFCNYVLVRAKGFPGYFDLLPRLYESNPGLGYLQSSVEAVALASFAQFKRMTTVYFRMSLQAYGLALAQLGLVLNHTSEAHSQHVAASVSMLWMYDVCVYLPF